MWGLIMLDLANLGKVDDAMPGSFWLGSLCESSGGRQRAVVVSAGVDVDGRNGKGSDECGCSNMSVLDGLQRVVSSIR